MNKMNITAFLTLLAVLVASTNAKAALTPEEATEVEKHQLNQILSLIKALQDLGALGA